MRSSMVPGAPDPAARQDGPDAVALPMNQRYRYGVVLGSVVTSGGDRGCHGEVWLQPAGAPVRDVRTIAAARLQNMFRFPQLLPGEYELGVRCFGLRAGAEEGGGADRADTAGGGDDGDEGGESCHAEREAKKEDFSLSYFHFISRCYWTDIFWLSATVESSTTAESAVATGVSLQRWTSDWNSWDRARDPPSWCRLDVRRDPRQARGRLAVGAVGGQRGFVRLLGGHEMAGALERGAEVVLEDRRVAPQLDGAGQDRKRACRSGPAGCGSAPGCSSPRRRARPTRWRAGRRRSPRGSASAHTAPGPAGAALRPRAARAPSRAPPARAPRGDGRSPGAPARS